MTFAQKACALVIHRAAIEQPKSTRSSPRLLLNVAILLFRLTERPNFAALTSVAAAADRSRPPAAGARPDYNAKAAPRLRDAALIEKWRDCSLTAGTSLSRYWSRSGYQLHIPDTCSEPGRCRPWNRYRNHRSPLSRSAHYCERRRPGSKSLPSR